MTTNPNDENLNEQGANWCPTKISSLTGDIPHISTSSESESEDLDGCTTMPSGYSPSHEDNTHRRSRKRCPGRGFKTTGMHMPEVARWHEYVIDKVPVEVPFLAHLSTIAELNTFNKALSGKQHRQRIMTHLASLATDDVPAYVNRVFRILLTDSIIEELSFKGQWKGKKVFRETEAYTVILRKGYYFIPTFLLSEAHKVANESRPIDRRCV
ncbi:unnamed protein product [Dibothriocephalus latus]|uniref:DUF4806 domain-containing protein n=1 Tax=Dibothriocephalus latus TaxID=60516 RepID=A0A3P7M3M1_DIBLA|nr:unnamed protein product [Dibothriocephalus latus]